MTKGYRGEPSLTEPYADGGAIESSKQRSMFPAMTAVGGERPVPYGADSQAAPYTFPTAGSFVAEAYRDDGMPAFSMPPSQPSYPSGGGEKYYQRERSYSPMGGRVSPMPGGNYGDPGSGAHPPGIGYGSYAHGEPMADPYGNSQPRQEQACHYQHSQYAGPSQPPSYPHSYGYSGDGPQRGDGGYSYSGKPNSYAAPQSYGPPPYASSGGGAYPGAAGAAYPGSYPGLGSTAPYGELPPPGAGGDFGYSFPTAGSFVAEPFAPGAPSPIPMPRPAFAGEDQMHEAQMRWERGSMQMGMPPPALGPYGGTNSPCPPPLPPSQGSFLANPSSFMMSSGGGASCLSGPSPFRSGPSPLDPGVSYAQATAGVQSQQPPSGSVPPPMHARADAQERAAERAAVRAGDVGVRERPSAEDRAQQPSFGSSASRKPPGQPTLRKTKSKVMRGCC